MRNREDQSAHFQAPATYRPGQDPTPPQEASHGPRRWLVIAVAVVGVAAGTSMGVAVALQWLQPADAQEATTYSLASLVKSKPPSPAEPKERRPDKGKIVSAPRTPNVAVGRSASKALASPYDWAPEPESPRDVDPARFEGALARLCGRHSDPQVRKWYTPWIFKYAREHGVDPFLLGGLVKSSSDCRSDDPHSGVGLTGIWPGLYEDRLEGSRYSYPAYDGEDWVLRTQVLDRFPFRADFLDAPESNLYFAAAFLHTWKEQQRGLRVAFPEGLDARHPVAHFFWGDVVKSHREADDTLVQRRRLLEYYGSRSPMPPVKWRGFELSCPLDGCPRVVTSTLGAEREGGKRRHRGVDFESKRGEPVRAVASGRVFFAGVDMPGKAAHKHLPIYAQRQVGKSLMGAGGLYVCIRHPHPEDEDPLISCYMHLESASVAQGRVVEGGEEIGRVGRTGIKHSLPHLHFELLASDGIHAATEALPGIVLGPAPPTDAPRK